MKNLQLFALIILIIKYATITNYAQCSSCTLTITAPSSATYNLTSNTTVCIIGSGTFSGQLNNFNGNTLCIGTGVIYNPSTAPNYNGVWTINNYGTFQNTNNLNFNSNDSFHNYPTGSISLGSININSGTTFINEGTLTTTGITVNSGGTISLGGTTTINGSLNNNGSITVIGNVVATSITNNSGGTIVGGGTSCNSIRSTGTFTNNGVYGNTGQYLYVGNTGGSIVSPATSTSPNTPNSQPTNLILSNTGTTINGSFTQCTSNGYLILRAVGTSLPATTNPTNFSNISVGQTLGAWTIVAINTSQTATSFSDNVGTGVCSTIYYRIYAFNSGGYCRVYNTTNPLTGVYNLTPSIVSTSPNSNCGSGTVTLNATSSSGTVSWYTTNTGGSSVATGTSYTTPSISSSTTYYVDATNAGCTTSTRTSITATINSVPTATISGSGSLCTTNTITVTLTGTAPWNISYSDGSTTINQTGIASSPYTFTSSNTATNYTLTNVSNAACTGTYSGTVSLTYKKWSGTTNSNWNVDSNWSPSGVPTNSDAVVVFPSSNNPIINSGNAYACTLIVKSGASLYLATGNTITVNDKITIESGGTFQLEDKSSLIQINDVGNSGSIIYKRNASIRMGDYVYYSSPVANFDITNLNLTTPTGPKYIWNPTISNPNNGQGNWTNLSSNIMTVGGGYIVRGPSSYSTSTPQTFTATFTGTPNNGSINYPISRGSYTGNDYNGLNGIEISNLNDNYNLVGNPYPSAISASQFLLNNNNTIIGKVSLWTHQNLPSSLYANTFYQSFSFNYTASDYYTYNFTGTSCCPAASDDLYIGAGQSFFITMKDGPTATSNITFSNTMRNNSYSNSTFYKTNSGVSSPTNIQRNRVWLDIIDATNQLSNRTLVGYIEGASDNYDNLFDSPTTAVPPIGIYSLIHQDKYEIQGKSLPFTIDDKIDLGVYVTQAGTYQIAIAGVDGLFENQNLFLYDTELNIIFNLKKQPYSFTADAGQINNRFQLIFKNNQLDLSEEQNVLVATNASIGVYSNSDAIQSITVYDVLGQLIKRYESIDQYNFTIRDIAKNNAALLLKIELQNNTSIVKKIIY